MATPGIPPGNNSQRMEPGWPNPRVTSEQLTAAYALLRALALVRGSKRAAQEAQGNNRQGAPAAQGTDQETSGADDSARYEALRRAAKAPLDYEDAVLKWQSAYKWLEKVSGGDPGIIDAAYSLAKSDTRHVHNDPSQ